MMRSIPVATQLSMSSHSAKWSCSCFHLTLNGIPPLLEGDTHLCLLNQPSIHPQIPCKKPGRHITVNGLQWLGAGDSVECLGPCIVMDGCKHVFFGEESQEEISTQSTTDGIPFSL